MPLIEEILDLLAGAHFISKIDLNTGFYQSPIMPDGMKKTAFCSPWSKFKFKFTHLDCIMNLKLSMPNG